MSLCLLRISYLNFAIEIAKCNTQCNRVNSLPTTTYAGLSIEFIGILLGEVYVIDVMMLIKITGGSVKFI